MRVSDLISFTFAWLDTDKPLQAIGFVAATVGSLFLAVHGPTADAVGGCWAAVRHDVAVQRRSVDLVKADAGTTSSGVLRRDGSRCQPRSSEVIKDAIACAAGRIAGPFWSSVIRSREVRDDSSPPSRSDRLQRLSVLPTI